MTWQPVIGFEVHVELATVSKMFCGCSADHFAKPPNTQTCPVCLGLPGALPVPNSKAIEWCIKLGLALGCRINLNSKFDRKNYFYPDLAKGYQISQYDQPFCYSGSILINTGKTIRITRVHMEEDTGKLQHVELPDGPSTLVDFNRSGVPLVEIVTEPDFASADEALDYLKQIQQLVRVLGISSADMEKGTMRLEANISLRDQEDTQLPSYKVEIKNVNSFRFVKKAIEYEISRQSQLLDQGIIPEQETRGFNEDQGSTFSQRSKESAHDYRYFPEPDIPPMVFTKKQINAWRAELPVLPQEQKQALITHYGLTEVYSSILIDNANLLQLFTYALQHTQVAPKKIADLIINQFTAKKWSTADEFIAYLHALSRPVMIDSDKINAVISEVLISHPDLVSQIKGGKPQVKGLLLRDIRAQLENVDMAQVNDLLNKALAN